ncbi:MAG: 3-dehydroquinate synthase [Denitrovibrio sp.]|nr:MAG: 3-dehydroquinate synthase [Denitrovibrio sp.]
MSTLKLHSNIHDYEVEFCDSFAFLDDIKKIEKKVFVLDKNIYELYKDLFTDVKEEDLFLFDAIEEKKTLKSVEEIYKFLATKDAKRNITLISFGGGVTQDVTGFAAATLYRGIKWIFVPTTFLAQADSCIGSKTSLNFETYKNILGGFYPPDKIYIQPKFLDTLSTKDYYSGIGEIIKFALLKESYPKDFDAIVELVESVKGKENRLEAIKKTMEVKKAYIDEDEFDTGKRNLFNYGHCFGHALENSSHYEIPHGIAVTIGMIYANIVALNRGLISKERYLFLNEKLFLPNIPIELDKKQFDETILLDSMKNDKKRVGKNLTIVIPVNDDIAAEKIDDLTIEEFKKVLKDLIEVLALK